MCLARSLSQVRTVEKKKWFSGSSGFIGILERDRIGERGVIERLAGALDRVAEKKFP